MYIYVVCTDYTFNQNVTAVEQYISWRRKRQKAIIRSTNLLTLNLNLFPLSSFSSEINSLRWELVSLHTIRCVEFYQQVQLEPLHNQFTWHFHYMFMRCKTHQKILLPNVAVTYLWARSFKWPKTNCRKKAMFLRITASLHPFLTYPIQYKIPLVLLTNEIASYIQKWLFKNVRVKKSYQKFKDHAKTPYTFQETRDNEAVLPGSSHSFAFDAQRFVFSY